LSEASPFRRERILPEDVGFVGFILSRPDPTLPSVILLPSGISIADGSASETAKTTWQIKEDVFARS
jgi:hypothetical protein